MSISPMRFEFATAREIVFGTGAVRTLAERVRPHGASVLVVTGADPARAASVLEAMNEAGLAVTIWPAAGEPTIDDARAAVREAHDERVEVIVGIGGGSAIDLAKAVAVLTTNGGDPLEYIEVIGGGRPLLEPPLPTVAVPTTAGAGAEVTRNAVLLSREHGVKASLRSPLMLPRLALIDPELTLSLPPDVTAATGMDALAQLLEPYVSARANPFTDAICLDGFPRVARALARAWRDGGDIEARAEMSLAALYGGLALANAGLGAVHGFAAVIGGRFDAPHGAVCAALLPGVVRANAAALADRDRASPTLVRYQCAARILTGRSDATPADLAEWLGELRRTLQIPGLRAYGVDETDAEPIVAASARASSMRANPIVLEPDELHAVLESAL
jgi:alcohol dehydrogenase class IV